MDFLASVLKDNALFFRTDGINQSAILRQAGKEEIIIRGIFSRVENTETALDLMLSVQFQAQIVFESASLPQWFGLETTIELETASQQKKVYAIERTLEDDMLGRMIVYLKDFGKREVPR